MMMMNNYFSAVCDIQTFTFININYTTTNTYFATFTVVGLHRHITDGAKRDVSQSHAHFQSLPPPLHQPHAEELPSRFMLLF